MINVKYKTSLCKNFMNNGDCPLKERCMFAHGHNELKKEDAFNTPFNNDGINKLIDNKNNKNYKKQLCRHYQLGNCKLGDVCNFAHGSYDIKLELNKNENNIINNQNMNNNQNENIVNNLDITNCVSELNNFYNSSKNQLFALKHEVLASLNIRSAKNIEFIFKSIYINLDNYTIAVENMKNYLCNEKELNNDDLKVLKQLKFIAQNLSSIYATNEGLIEKINMAKSLLDSKKVKESAEVLQRILFDNELYNINKIKHDIIIQNAKKLY